MKVWLPKYLLAIKDKELWEVFYDSPPLRNPEDYYVVEIPESELEVCRECC